MRLLSLSIAIAAILSGCLPRAQIREEPNSQTALPKLDMKLTVTVLDEETGKPIPDAWVLVAAHITTDRPAPSGDLDAIAAARSVTSRQGTAWISEVQGTYYPGQPKNDAWRVMEQARADRLGPRKITGVEGGDIVVASPIYGFIHQPFAVEDDPTFQDWLKKNRKEDYSGWIRKTAVKVNLPPVFVESKDLKRGLALTIKMRKPRDLDDWAKTISLSAFIDATWLAMSVDTGATEEDQRRLYWLFGRTLDQIGLRSGKMEHVESFSIYLRDEAIKYYVGHAPKPEDQDSTIQLWLAQKALELLPQDSTEVKEHIGSILKGVADEGKDPRWKNHFLDPKDPTRGLPGADSALKWAAVDADNARNDWDWDDAQRYYAAGDKAKAYEALGHVLRLLVNLAIPKYSQMQEAKETEFETAVETLMKQQAGQLPPDYWWATKEPAFATTPRARFDDVAGRTVVLGLEAGIGATNGHAESPALAQARKSFPAAIGHAAGLMRDFYQLMHRPRFVGPPGDGDGDGWPKTSAQSSSSTATEMNKFNKFTSDTGSFGGEAQANGNPEGVNVGQRQPVTLSDAGIEAVLEKVFQALAGPDTAGSQQRAMVALAALSPQGNALIPHLTRFIESEKPFHRRFAIDALIAVNSAESLKLVYKKFWALYRSASDIEKIGADAASLAYHQPQLGINLPKAEPYWEARDVMRKLIKRDAKGLRELCAELAGDANGIGVMAARCTWNKGGESHEEMFLRFESASVDGEAFFSFVDELADIAKKEEAKNYPGFEEARPRIKRKLEAVCASANSEEAVFGQAIDYLSEGEKDWFAENWPQIYAAQHRSKGWLYKRISIANGVSGDARARKNVQRLEQSRPRSEYEDFLTTVEEISKRRDMIKGGKPTQ